MAELAEFCPATQAAVLNNRFFLSVDHVFGTLKAFVLSWVSAQ